MSYNNMKSESHQNFPESNYNYPLFFQEPKFDQKKIQNMCDYNVDNLEKNNLKESLLPREEDFGNFKQSHNYEEQKQTSNFADNVNNGKNNNLVESKQYQIDFISNNPQPQVKNPQVSSNILVQNECCSCITKTFLDKQQGLNTNLNYNPQQQGTMNYNNANVISYPPQKGNVVYNNNINSQYYPNCYNINNPGNYNYPNNQNNFNNQQTNNLNYSKPPNYNNNNVNFSSQPAIINSSQYNSNNTISSLSQKMNDNNNINNNQSFNYLTVPSNQHQSKNINNNPISQSNNVISYSFNNKNKLNSVPISFPSQESNKPITNQVTQTVNKVPESYLQMNCSKCKTMLAYPQGCKGVFCPLCQTVSPIVKMEFILCGKCKVCLTFVAGSKHVKCQNCSIVNLSPYFIKK